MVDKKKDRGGIGEFGKNELQYVDALDVMYRESRCLKFTINVT